MKRYIVGIRHPEERSRPATGRGQPSIWFPSMSTMAAVLLEANRALLRLIRDQRPKSLKELAALALCFDVVETKAASYLGLLIPHTLKEPRPGWKPKSLPRFVIQDAEGRAWSLVGPGIKRLKFRLECR